VVVTVSAGQGYTGTPTGQVVATLDNGSQATQTLVGGQTTFAYPSPAVGTHQVAVSYKGDATFDVSTGQGSFRVQASGGPGQPAQDSGVSGFRNAAAVVPSDNTDLPTPALALYIGATGAVVLNMLNGQTVTLSALQAGTFVYLNITRVKSTGTTAGSLVALW
jgi:phage baseplate assembly protein gpV